MRTKRLRPYYTMVVPPAFLIPHAFLSRFCRVFPCVYDTNMLVSKTQVKTQGKCKKNARKIQNASPTEENVSILHYALGKNVSQLRFARVMLTFCSPFAHKPYQNANPTHSVIWPLVSESLGPTPDSHCSNTPGRSTIA